MKLSGCINVVFSLCGCWLLMGCQTDSEEHGHEIPAHKPASFYRAADSLNKRWSVCDNWSAEDRQQFVDIAGWLPELAAQTELSRLEWERVQELSQTLLAEVQNRQDKNVAATLTRLLTELADLAETAARVDQFHSQLPEKPSDD
ncbi:MAG: hypothetical protein R3C12_01400 [Planctomycetaceae bacterium]|nr:hypothetical protein [Planctomycetaceae bacterium]